MTNTARVLHVIPSFSTRDGGPTHALAKMCALANAHGFVAHVATTDADGSGHLAVRHAEPLEHLGTRTWFFPVHFPLAWRCSSGLARWLKRNVANYDLVHVHALFSHSTFAACRVAAAARVSYILRPLGQLDSWSVKQHRWKKLPYYIALEREHLVKARAIHVTSESERESVLSLGLKTPIFVVPNAITISGIPREAEEGAALRLLFLSRLHPKKGLELLLQAAARLRHRDWQLTIAGDGAAPYLEQLKVLAKELGLSERVAFVGFVDGTAKQKLFANSNVLVLPSYQENFGIAVAEAMGHGLAVIVSDAVALAPSIRSRRAGLVVPSGSIEQLCEALGAISPSQLRQMGERGRELAREHYGDDAVWEKLHALYQACRAPDLVERSTVEVPRGL
jgi:glycosyltransferase involved in cell wall biosynthesis